MTNPKVIDAGWLLYMMDRLDYEYETRGGRSFPNLKKKPSDYVKTCSVYVTCEPEETCLAYVTDVIGQDRLMFPSDYPHERRFRRWHQRFLLCPVKVSAKSGPPQSVSMTDAMHSRVGPKDSRRTPHCHRE